MADPWEDDEWPGWQHSAPPQLRRRRRWLLVLIAVFALWQLTASIPANVGLSCAQAAARAGHATVHTATVVSVACPTGRAWHINRWPTPIARGSAFRVRSDHWLTAAHIVEPERVPEGYELRWYAIDSSGHPSLVRDVHRADGVDAASFESDASGALTALAPSEPARGQHVVAWGQQDLHDGHYQLQMEARGSDEQGTPVLIASPPVEHGYSGGPALDGSGRAVGIVYAITDRYTIIVPIEAARKL